MLPPPENHRNVRELPLPAPTSTAHVLLSPLASGTIAPTFAPSARIQNATVIGLVTFGAAGAPTSTKSSKPSNVIACGVSGLIDT